MCSTVFWESVPYAGLPLPALGQGDGNKDGGGGDGREGKWEEVGL